MYAPAWLLYFVYLFILEGGTKLARGDHFWLPKSVRGDRFWQGDRNFHYSAMAKNASFYKIEIPFEERCYYGTYNFKPTNYEMKPE